MPEMLRPRHEFPTPLFRLTVPVLLIALLAGWDAAVISEKSWLFAGIFLCVALPPLPLFLRLRTLRGLAVATLVLIVVAHFVAFVVWAPFVNWP